MLVVLSHALQDHPAPGGAAVWQLLWYVDMPLFVLLAGFAFGYARRRPFLTQVGRRARQLLIPYVAWGLIRRVVLKSGMTLEAAGTAVYNVLFRGAGSWFLLALFVFEVLLLGLRRITERAWGLVVSGFAITCAVALLRALSPEIDHVGRTLLDTQKYFFYYVVGYVACTQAAEWVRYRRVASIVAVIAMPAALAFKHLGGLPAFVALLDAAAVPARGVVVWAVGYCAQVAISLSASILAFTGIRLVSDERLRPLAFIGSSSLGIYLIHTLLRRLVPGEGWFAVMAAVTIGLVISTGATSLIARQPFLNAVLLGGRARAGHGSPGRVDV